jgi:hypothetical protein
MPDKCPVCACPLVNDACVKASCDGESDTTHDAE